MWLQLNENDPIRHCSVFTFSLTGQHFKISVLRIRIRDWVPFWHLDPGSGMGESQHQDLGSGMNNPSYFLELRNHFFAFLGVKILKFFDEDPGSGMETVRIRDGKKSDPGSGINIPDPQHCKILNFFRKLIQTFWQWRICECWLKWGPHFLSECMLQKPPLSIIRLLSGICHFLFLNKTDNYGVWRAKIYRDVLQQYSDLDGTEDLSKNIMTNTPNLAMTVYMLRLTCGRCSKSDPCAAGSPSLRQCRTRTGCSCSSALKQYKLLNYFTDWDPSINKQKQ